MWGVMVRPWCWEVAGPWTAAAWFTTPAVPPHRGSRRCSGSGWFPSLGPSPCILQGLNRDQSVSLLISGTSVAAVKKERKKKCMQIRLKGNYSRCGISLGSFCWVYVITPVARDSGRLWPTSHHLTGIRAPPTLSFRSGASALNNIPYANFIITAQPWGMCVYVHWRGI